MLALIVPGWGHGSTPERAMGADRTLPEGAVRLDEAFVAQFVPQRDPDGHKGTFGALLAVCGSLDYAGAGLLAGAAALRAGAGLVTLCVPASLQLILAGRVPELITLGLPETAPFIVDPEAAAASLAGRPHTALLAGPGLRPGPETRDLVLRLLHGGSPEDALTAPILIDAEAINSLARVAEWWSTPARPTVLTPHPGEFARLEGEAISVDDADRAARAAAAARRWGAVVVLKGARTVVAAPDGRLAQARFENPALGTGGTGDVLAGIGASLLAQGLPPWEAACLAVYLQGAAGDHVRDRVGDAGLLASDLLAEVPRVRRHLAGVRDRSAPGRRVGFVSRVDPDPGR
jgi:ADP-dependent NAD(P)H-hydrate dehydratase / NAD(P)H-hydrate epimerase